MLTLKNTKEKQFPNLWREGCAIASKGNLGQAVPEENAAEYCSNTLLKHNCTADIKSLPKHAFPKSKEAAGPRE